MSAYLLPIYSLRVVTLQQKNKRTIVLLSPLEHFVNEVMQLLRAQADENRLTLSILTHFADEINVIFGTPAITAF
jgi:hypothetical protein